MRILISSGDCTSQCHNESGHPLFFLSTDDANGAAEQARGTNGWIECLVCKSIENECKKTLTFAKMEKIDGK